MGNNYSHAKIFKLRLVSVRYTDSMQWVTPNQTLYILYMLILQGKLTVSAATNKSLDIS